MKLSVVLFPALLSAAGPACLFLAACEPVDDPNAKPRHWQAPLEAPRRATNMDPANVQWLSAWRDLRSRLAPLEARLAELQKLHSESRFDNFLTLDVDTLSVEQLSSLYHFLQRGYFTVERRALVHLLERRFDRTDSALAIPSDRRRSIRENLATAMHRDEIRMVDLETAIRFYEETGDTNFRIPTQLTEEEIAELRDVVFDMQETTRAEIAEMDKKIAVLRARAFPGMEPDPGTTAPAENGAVTTAEITPAGPQQPVGAPGNPAPVEAAPEAAPPAVPEMSEAATPADSGEPEAGGVPQDQEGEEEMEEPLPK